MRHANVTRLVGVVGSLFAVASSDNTKGGQQ
jgi:hypothetical protein